MRRLALFVLSLLAACAGPQPCTRTLCVAKLDGTLELRGWSGAVRAAADSPTPPVPSDSEIAVVHGSAEFVHGTSRLTASEGSVFRFSVSTAAIASIEVSSGALTVALSSGAPMALTPGAPFALPKP